MIDDVAAAVAAFPPLLESYPSLADAGIGEILWSRIAAEPFNAVATGIFVLAILHTFAAPRIAALAHEIKHRHDAAAGAAPDAARLARERRPPQPSLIAEALHFFGEVEVVFGLWAIVLLTALTAYAGWETAKHYFNDGVDYREPMFVVVIMALASTRPIIVFAEAALKRLAALGRETAAAWWMTILIVGPVLGSFITEPAAMTICALLLARQFYDLRPGTRLKYATLGLLFVNVSIGGTFTHFAAPPVLMVARPWGWDTMFMLSQFGWRAAIAVVASTLTYFLIFRTELRSLSMEPPRPDVEKPDEDAPPHEPALLPVPAWITTVHIAFMAWTVFNAHYPALFLGGFLFFLGFARATSAYQSQVSLRTPLLVGFFLGGLVIHGGLQAWWIAPVLSSLSEVPLFIGATLLTAVNDNALITFLATLVPSLSESMKLAVVQGAVTGGGLTVIANAPNPAGQALLSRFFDDGAISPVGLFTGAVLPTVIAALAFRLL